MHTIKDGACCHGLNGWVVGEEGWLRKFGLERGSDTLAAWRAPISRGKRQLTQTLSGTPTIGM